MLYNWVSEFITSITYLSESLYILSALSTLFGRYGRYIRFYYQSPVHHTLLSLEPLCIFWRQIIFCIRTQNLEQTSTIHQRYHLTAYIQDTPDRESGTKFHNTSEIPPHCIHSRHSGPRIWNKLPQYIRDTTSLHTFKTLRTENLEQTSTIHQRYHLTAYIQDTPDRESGTNFHNTSEIPPHCVHSRHSRPRIWNKLPQYIRDTTSLRTFKTLLKAHLFQEVYHQ